MSLRAYAKHRKVSAEAVRKAIKTGRLRKSVVDVAGTPQIADIALADREWAANTDLSRAHDDVKEKAARQGNVLVFQEPQPHGGSLQRKVAPPPDPSIAAASAQEKHWRAKKAELDYKRAAGELVNAHDISARLADLFTTCRTKLLGLPTKAKSQLPHLTLKDIAVLDTIVREGLEQLATEHQVAV